MHRNGTGPWQMRCHQEAESIAAVPFGECTWLLSLPTPSAQIILHSLCSSWTRIHSHTCFPILSRGLVSDGLPYSCTCVGGGFSMLSAQLASDGLPYSCTHVGGGYQDNSVNISPSEHAIYVCPSPPQASSCAIPGCYACAFLCHHFASSRACCIITTCHHACLESAGESFPPFL